MGMCDDWLSRNKLNTDPNALSIEVQHIQKDLGDLQAKSQNKKLIVTFPEDFTKIEATPQTQSLKLDSNATYLLIGGLGGLGVSLLTMLVERGARTFVILSPSAGTTPASKKLMAEVESVGCSIIPISGEAQSLEDVKRAVAAAPGPVKGVIHLAMRLRVRQLLQNVAFAC